MHRQIKQTALFEEDEPVRKSVSLPRSLWEKVMHIRHRDRIETQGEAIRKLLEVAVAMDEKSGRLK